MDKVNLNIGGFGFSIQSENSKIIDLLKEGFGSFISGGKNVDMKIEIVCADSFRQANPYIYGNPHKTSVFRQNDRLYIQGSIYRGYFNEKRSYGEIRQGISIQPTYLFLRNLLSIYLPEKNGFMLHAASILSGKKAYIFTGRPQAGKSTIAKLSAADNRVILSDDFSIIRKINGVFHAFASPFWGHVETGSNLVNKYFPVDSLYFIRQDTGSYKRSIPMKDALKGLLGNVCFLGYNGPKSDKILGLSYDFVKNIPVYYLHFAPDKQFWRCIEDE